MPFVILAVIFVVLKSLWDAIPAPVMWIIVGVVFLVSLIVWWLKKSERAALEQKWERERLEREEQKKQKTIEKEEQQKLLDRAEELRLEVVEALSNDFYLQLVLVVEKHAAILAKKRSQILYFDDYGVLCGADQWSKEVRYFRDNVLMQSSEINDVIAGLAEQSALEKACLLVDDNFLRLQAHIDTYLDQFATENEGSTVVVDKLDGTEFEVHCAQALEQDSWSVVRKGGSGDQGVDLIASLGQLRVAVQCKRYSQPVGNKAVQEVAAGRQFEQCDLAVVVSNAHYTPSARQLASALGVMLLHHSELANFRVRVESQFSALVSGEASV